MFDVAVSCLVLTALLSYLNHRFIGLPTTIGVMGIALLLSFALFGLDKLGFGALREYEVSLLSSVDFSELLMQGMLSLLLFAGALHVDLSELKSYRWQVGILAIFGTLTSTLLVGFGLWVILPYTGIALPLTYCLIFGALISPTDPIAVMGILKSVGAPKSLEIVISGESLFNDGVGVVLFSLLLAMLASGEAPTAAHGAMLLLEEGGGGIAFGLVLGYVTYRMLKSIDSYQEEVLITLAAVLGGYALADRLHVSGPLAMVVAGLIIGNHGRAQAMSHKTREHLDMFWELLDSILNAVLFVLIGLEVILIEFSTSLALAALAVIAITLTARLLSVGTPIILLGRVFRLPRGALQVLTWGGLRGGISVALALSLPSGPQRDVVLALTYAVVVFSILVQGLSIGKVVRSVGDTD
ncbi:Na+/H+ antiporter [Sulfuricella denitrificans skB26]|uniref:Na+/H+ antiporter n=1 Tax=Sulfuricella denitrificans (strain DSM 22764 / NBRC 105220 / skB26) TaxID=1163617 RepID=S6A9R0_SULDS|nr:sodium:proton antiporter [Sulfuricella denitrificans]BAN34545.1 Na+/H+ antiporter [Sulfuricella denitrificans skB26]